MTVSSIVGSEPGQLSFGGGGALVQSARISIRLVDRTRRKETIWEIQDRWRKQIQNFKGVQSFQIMEYGATPLSTTKAPLDVIISGPDPRMISALADQSLDRLKGLSGLVDVKRSWYFDKREYTVEVNPDLARIYHTDPSKITFFLKGAIKGIPTSSMRLSGYLDIPILVQFQKQDINRAEKIEDLYFFSSAGPLPLRTIARVYSSMHRPFITRERLQNTIESLREGLSGILGVLLSSSEKGESKEDQI